jgi:DNA-binding Lrp family transcriptional regulator
LPRRSRFAAEAGRAGLQPSRSFADFKKVRCARFALSLPGPQWYFLPMDPLLKLLQEDATAKPAHLAKMLNVSEADVIAKIKQYEADRVILGYHTILNDEKLGLQTVRALIEVKITPERGGGFDRLAERVAKYSEVRSCFLMSGGYDLLVVVEGNNLRDVARFVAEKLSTIQGVISTATHFMLKTYKDHGLLVNEDGQPERLAVAP